MEERARRVGVNEAMFRAANERLKELNEAFATVTETYDLICECGDARCVERFRMEPDAYTALREDASLFAVMRGHEDPSSEDIVEERTGYVVVRKRVGGPAELAHNTNP